MLATAVRSEPSQFPGRDPVRPQGAVDCAADLYKQAGITNPREQLDCAEIYVPFSWLEPMWLEAHGIADEGATDSSLTFRAFPPEVAAATPEPPAEGPAADPPPAPVAP